MLRRPLAAVLAFLLRMGYALRDERTPRWARATAWGLIAYIVWPLDFSPDLVPVVGWSDDLLALVAALATLAWYSRGDMKQRAASRARQILRLDR